MAASKKDVAKQQVKEDREKVRGMYLSGKTVKEIAKETYFSSSYCYAMVRDLAKRKESCKESKKSTSRRSYERGVSVSTIAKEYGISKTAIYETFHQENVRAGILQKRGRPRKNTERNALIAKRHREGEKVQALATEYNLSVSTVNTICSRNKNQNITSY